MIKGKTNIARQTRTSSVGTKLNDTLNEISFTLEVKVRNIFKSPLYKDLEAIVLVERAASRNRESIMLDFYNSICESFELRVARIGCQCAGFARDLFGMRTILREWYIL
jgi:hypothetical protein